MASPPDNGGFVAAAYLITGGALGAYVARLFARATRARRRTAAIVARRGGPPARLERPSP